MNGNRECIASPQKQSELLAEVRSAIDEYLSVFESEANEVAGADGVGVKGQCGYDSSYNVAAFLYCSITYPCIWV